jgi:site-specific DNA recombinase
MNDVEAGCIDCIVVYKIDRLSRSLMDFARIMDVFDQHGVSLVSVTQQFNTSSSMGRLTLNILLSFAQFEREIISERTRDKMIAAKRKGKWIGGHPVLGYDVAPDGGRLVVNKIEAEEVREIFQIYLEEGSIQRTTDILRERGWKTKRYQTRDGNWRGGKPLTKPTVRRLLNSVVYTGRVSCKGEIVEGEHEAIIEQEVFDKVQKLMKRNRAANENSVRKKHSSLLAGLLRCKHCGSGMTHAFTSKRDRRYRYYVCINAQKNGWSLCPAPTLPAREIEQFVVDQIRLLGRDGDLLKETLSGAEQHIEEECGQLEEERRELDRAIREIGRQIGTLGPRAGVDEQATQHLGELHELLRDKQQELRRVDDQLAAVKERMLDPDELAGALEAFDPVWDSLPLGEQAKLMHLLVERIDYDAEAESISISYHPAGIRTLIEENTVCQAT